MAQFSSDNTSQARVLIFDPNNSNLVFTDKVLKVAVAACQRHNCYWEFARKGTVTDAQLNGEWDMVLCPLIDDAIGANYTDFQTNMEKLHDTTIPIAVMQVVAPAVNATAQGVTGALTDRTAGATKATTFTWQSRSLTEMHFYGEAATSLHADATALATDGTNIPMWQYDIGDHPTLWIAGYASSENAGTPMYKPWLCFQWMCDQQSTAAKNTAVRSKVKPSFCIHRMDGFDDNNSATALADGSLDDWYDAAVSGGLVEIHNAAVGQGVADIGATNAGAAAWYAARNENQGGLFRAHNHHNDVVDGSAGPANSECTSDGAAFDDFEQAGQKYEATCDILTGTYNIKLGSDGYGRGYPNVQNGNLMNNPAALFLGGGDNPYRVWSSADSKYYGGYGCHLMLEESDTYPVGGAAAENPEVDMKYSRNWNGGQTVTMVNGIDSLAYSESNASLQFNLIVLKAYLYCGGNYLHANVCANMALFMPDYTSNFNACPHVFKSGPWEDQLTELQRGSGMWVEL